MQTLVVTLYMLTTLARSVFDSIAPLLARLLRRVQRLEAEAKIRGLKRKLQSCGADVVIRPTAAITTPRGVAIGCNVHIGDHTYISGEGGVQIQDHVHISSCVTIYGSDNSFLEVQRLSCGRLRTWKEVIIGPNVWIGMNACILPGVSIGEGAIVGMGTVVAEDVPPGTIIGQPRFRVIGKRAFGKDVQTKMVCRCDGSDDTPTRHARFDLYNSLRLNNVNGWQDLQSSRLFFVVTTGRSGSTTIASLLDQHPDIDARHEPRLQLIQWSSEFAHGVLSPGEIRKKLHRLFLETSCFRPGAVIIESDQKHSHMIPQLYQLLPNVKFIWLTRRGYDFVASAAGRGWYADEDHPVRQRRPYYYDSFRVQGDLMGEVEPETWRIMSNFERVCWYWSSVNRTIERDLRALPRECWHHVRIEELVDETAELLDFIGVSEAPIKIRKVNRAHHPRFLAERWSDEQHVAFDRWCGMMMRRLYPSDLPLKKTKGTRQYASKNTQIAAIDE